MNSPENAPIPSEQTSSRYPEGFTQEDIALVRPLEVGHLAAGARPEELPYDDMLEAAQDPNFGYTVMHAREIYEDVPVKHSVFERMKGFIGRQNLVDAAPPIWTESAEDYNARLLNPQAPEDISPAEMDMVQGDIAEYQANGGHMSNFNYYAALDSAYSQREGETPVGHTQMYARPILADEGATVIHRDGPPPPPPTLAN